MSKFIQIVAVTDSESMFPYIFALDEDGNVWSHIEGPGGKLYKGKWHQLAMERQPNAE